MNKEFSRSEVEEVIIALNHRIRFYEKMNNLEFANYLRKIKEKSVYILERGISNGN